MKTFLTAATIFLILASLFQPAKPILIGAYYYSWWRAGEWPKQQLNGSPTLGQYSSADPKIAEQHIRWAKESGLDFFVLSWKGPKKQVDKNIQEGFLKAKNIGQIKFALLYESRSRLGKKAPIDFNNPEISRTFEEDFSYLAKTYFNHHSYLKICGKPVVVLYVSRIFSGDLCAAIQKVRQNLKKKGFEIYLVGDEIWWAGRDEKRTLLWDGVTAYNLYYPTFSKDNVTTIADFAQKAKIVYSDWEKFLSDLKTQNKKPPDLIPGIFPQYDDYKLRKNPALYGTGTEDFIKMLALAQESASPVGPKKQKIILITSWNEWYEGTAIEPGRNNFGEEFFFLKIIKNWLKPPKEK